MNFFGGLVSPEGGVFSTQNALLSFAEFANCGSVIPSFALRASEGFLLFSRFMVTLACNSFILGKKKNPS